MEGNIDLELDILTETPLQLAAASGRVEIVELLLSFGSSPFLSTLKVDTMSFGSSAQKGCYCALSTAASHGQRKALHKLVTHPTTLTSQNSGREVGISSIYPLHILTLLNLHSSSPPPVHASTLPHLHSSTPIFVCNSICPHFNPSTP